MGVNKLHDQLRPHYNQVDALVDYKGLCVGVDALCWVHRAAKHAISSGDHDVDTLCARVSKFFQDYVGALTPWWNCTRRSPTPARGSRRGARQREP